MPVELSWDELPDRPGLEVEINLYRILQEGLANVEKHARASAVRVEIEGGETEVMMRIADQGCGFDVGSVEEGPGGSGLNNMRERAALMGGKAVIESTPGEGTVITIQLPLEVGEENEGDD